MRNLLTLFFLLAILCSCNNSPITKPHWLNLKDTLIVPNDKMVFLSPNAYWTVTLLTPIQPITLPVTAGNGHYFTSSLNHVNGITEGPAEICIAQEKLCYHYSVYLLNKKVDTIIHKDYRSPKTVNPDSSLHHQRMIHNLDKYRNILSFQKNKSNFFFEDNIYLPPKTAIYRADEKQPITSYYVQPGSCTNINIKTVYNKEKGEYSIVAGPLQDKHNNFVANGTLVTFIYKNAFETTQTEAAVINGYASIYIPSQKSKEYVLWAKINNTASNIITLKL